MNSCWSRSYRYCNLSTDSPSPRSKWQPSPSTTSCRRGVLGIGSHGMAVFAARHGASRYVTRAPLKPVLQHSYASFLDGSVRGTSCGADVVSVQCDEKRPCTNCIRYEIVCSLEVSGAPTPKSLSSPTTTSGDAGLDMGTVVAASAPTPVYRHSGHSTAVIVASSPHLASRDSRQTNRDALFLRSQSSQEPNSYYSPEWILSLRLFHHWCTSVYLTFSKDPATREIWGNAVPEMACNNVRCRSSIGDFQKLAHTYTHASDESPQTKLHHVCADRNSYCIAS
jgi:hypothetical protein